MFKIGIGPSSSHTVGPMLAAGRFLADALNPQRADARKVTVSLHGSLAFTGKGHATDRAVVLGLAGAKPDTIDPRQVTTIYDRIMTQKSLAYAGLPEISFDPQTLSSTGGRGCPVIAMVCVFQHSTEPIGSLPGVFFIPSAEDPFSHKRKSSPHR